jgi:tRNA-specific 2-thiouridylase
VATHMKNLSYVAPRRTVVVAMSGGIDSSVTAMLLQRQVISIFKCIDSFSHSFVAYPQGFDVVGLYMRNWDPIDEEGGNVCTQDRDFEDMQEVCAKLNIKRIHEVE